MGTLYALAGISIHPPRAGWDARTELWCRTPLHFNPPTPCGVGHIFYDIIKVQKRFQSTHPVRGGTSDRTILFRSCWVFQSTHPVRGGTIGSPRKNKTSAFQSTHPVRGGTSFFAFFRMPPSNFNPPTPCGVGLLYKRWLIKV